MGGFSGGKGGGGGGGGYSPPGGLQNINPMKPQFSQDLLNRAADPYQNAKLQQDLDLQANAFNSLMLNPNVASPYGTVSYDTQNMTINDANGNPIQYNRPTQRVTLNPEQQELLNLKNQASTKIGNIANNRIWNLSDFSLSENDLPQVTSRIDYSSVDKVPTMNDYNAQTKQVQDAYMDMQRRLLDPVFTQNEDRLRNQLVNSGNPMGSSMYDTELGNYRTKTNEAYRNVADQAILNSYDIQNLLFNNANTTRQNQVSAAQLPYLTENMVRQNEFDMKTALRNQQLNEIAMLLGQSPSITAPQLQNYNQTPLNPVNMPSFLDPINSMVSSLYGTDVKSLNDMYRTQTEAQSAADARDAQARNGAVSGLFSLGSSIVPRFF